MRLVVLLVFMLCGCTEYLVAAGAIEMQTIRDRQMYNDGKAGAITAGVCDISVGAISRMPEGAVRCGIGQICNLKLLECIPGIQSFMASDPVE
jgi:hypothetical protein